VELFKKLCEKIKIFYKKILKEKLAINNFFTEYREIGKIKI
jgi:hypothetical protein